MRNDRLNIDIRTCSTNDHLERLIDFSKAVVAQSPDSSLYKCLNKITRYMYVMRLNRFNYIVELVDDQIIIRLGKEAQPAAVIYQGQLLENQFEMA